MDPKGHHLTLRDEPGLVEVSIGGETLASSRRALVLEETGLPPRHYLPRDDVRMDALTSTEASTVCPFKGTASYWSVHVAGDTYRDLAWSYETPIDGMERITGLICFYDERVDLTVDGEARDRPVTAWSETG